LQEGRRSKLFVDKKKAITESQKIMDNLGGGIDARQKVESLSVSQKQIVEIAKAVSRDAKIMIFDEPTAALNNTESKILFDLIFDLKAKGVAIVFISHRLEEVFAISDKITVLRDGNLITTVDAKKINNKVLIKMMVGRELKELYPSKSQKKRNKVMEVKDLSSNSGVKNINFTVYKGEILGISGLVGAGRTEMAKALFGIDDKLSGELYIEGRKKKISSPDDAIELGVGYLPEERKETGLFLKMNIIDNISCNNLKTVSSYGFLDKGKEINMAEQYISKLKILTQSHNQKVIKLSGGNQQKVLLAKWLTSKPTVLIVDEPTRGIDVGAKQEIHYLLRNLADEGMAIIMISSELPEIIGMSDRILVMKEGKITREINNTKGVTQEEIMEYATR